MSSLAFDHTYWAVGLLVLANGRLAGILDASRRGGLESVLRFLRAVVGLEDHTTSPSSGS